MRLTGIQPVTFRYIVISYVLIIALISLLTLTNLVAAKSAYAQTDFTTNNSSNEIYSPLINNVALKKVHVGDIDVAYKIIGKGKPLILIAGSGASMDMWDPQLLKQLSVNHTVIIFDSRGKGQTSVGTVKNMTMYQFANDTAGLIDALKIKEPVDVLGASFGGFIAQELVLSHPNKVDNLILYASDCSGKIAVPSRPAPFASTPIAQARIVADMIFPEKWKKEHPNYLSYMPLVPVPSLAGIQVEGQAINSWKGSCDRVSNINKPTLVILGTEDVIVPPPYSLPLAEKIPGVWLVQINGGGHGLMYQYPEKLSRIILTFLEIVNNMQM
jgi:pimeloyl-ACP methyl ester carboxylesterase